jgi:hypothetical protein
VIYLNHIPISIVPRDAMYSTPFGFGNQSIGRFTASDIWQATPSVRQAARIGRVFKGIPLKNRSLSDAMFLARRFVDVQKPREWRGD